MAAFCTKVLLGPEHICWALNYLARGTPTLALPAGMQMLRARPGVPNPLVAHKWLAGLSLD